MERLRRPLMAALLLLGCVYQADGVFHLFTTGFTKSDLLMRWHERADLVKGIDPYDLSATYGDVRNEREKERLARFGLQDAPTGGVSGYPPWGLAASLLLLAPGPFVVTALWYLVLNSAALVLQMRLAFLIGSRASRDMGWLLALAVFAMFANDSTLRVGQYGLILNATLILAVLADRRGRHFAAGGALFLAALKPNYSLFQFAVALCRKRWVALAVAGLLCLCGSALVYGLTGAGPIEITQQMIRQTAYVTKADTSLAEPFRAIFPHAIRITLFAAAGAIGSLATSYRYRREAYLVAASAAAIWGRLFLYHRQYDNVMLAIPLIAIAAIAMARPSAKRSAATGIFASTLWAPLPLTAYTPGVIVALSAIWIAGGCFICRHAEELSEFLRKPVPRRALSGVA